MTLDQLKVLLTVVETGSFHAASEVLYRSRPAVSISIKNLEEELGILLFSREEYRPKLTHEGKIFCEKAQKVINHAEALQRLGEQLAIGVEPSITISINALCPLPAAMTILHFFRIDYPSVKMNLVVDYGKKPLKLLLAGEAHLALTELEDETGQLETLKWSTIKLLPVATPSFPLLEMKTEHSLEDILDYVQIVIKSGYNDPTEAVEILHEKYGNNYWEVSDFYIQRQIILSALGWGIMPQHLIQNELENGSLVPLNSKNIREKEIDIFLTRRVDRAIGPVAQKIWEAFR
ncbi:LysR family transcriptional regulator [Deltaproteobacteria bacterium TL4]